MSCTVSLVPQREARSGGNGGRGGSDHGGCISDIEYGSEMKGCRDSGVEEGNCFRDSSKMYYRCPDKICAWMSAEISVRRPTAIPDPIGCVLGSIPSYCGWVAVH